MRGGADLQAALVRRGRQHLLEEPLLPGAFDDLELRLASAHEGDA